MANIGITFRLPNTKRGGSPFTQDEIQMVWNSARELPNNPPALWRQDACNKPIYRHSYGALTKYGWEIDHVQPVSRGGEDYLYNLQALQWFVNRSKGDDYPQWNCPLGDGSEATR